MTSLEFLYDTVPGRILLKWSDSSLCITGLRPFSG